MIVRNTSIGQRLGMGFGAVFLLVLIMMGISRIGEQQQTEAMSTLTNQVMLKADAAKDVEIAYVLASGAARSYIYTGDDVWLIEYRHGISDGQDAFSRLNALPRNADEAALYGQVRTLANQWDQVSANGLALRQQGKTIEAEQLIQTQMKPTRDQLLSKLEDYIALQDQTRDTASTRANQVQAVTDQLSTLLALLVIVLGSLAAFLTTRSVTRPVRTLVQASQALASGDYVPAIELASKGGVLAENETTRDDVRLLSSTFGTMAQRLTNREARLAARARLSAVLAESLDAKATAQGSLWEIAEYLNCEFGAVYALPENGSALRLVAAYSIDSTPDTVDLGAGILGEAALSQKRVLVKDIPTDTPFQVRFGFDQVPPRTVVAQPMVLEGTTVGLILLGSLHDLSTDGLDFLDVSAQQLAVSLENAFAHQQVQALAEQLQEKNEILEVQNEELQVQSEQIQSQNEELQRQNEEIQAQNEELQGQSEEIQAQSEELAIQNVELSEQAKRVNLLQNITARLSTSLTPGEVLDQVVVGASTLLKSTKAGVFLLDDARQKFVQTANVGLDESQETSLHLDRAASLAGQVVDAGHTIFLQDISSNPNIQFPVLSGGENVGSLIVAPLRAAGETFGVIEVYFLTPRLFSDEEVDLLTSLGAAAGVAIRNSRLFSMVRQQIRLLDNVLAHIPEAVQVTDVTGQILVTNPAAKEIFGTIDPVVLQAAASHNERPPEEPALAEIWQPTIRAMRGERVIADELKFQNAVSGEDGFAQVSAVPIFGQSGHIENVVTVAADISRLKEIELQKDEFLTVASHELKSPLTSLKGFAQILQERMGPDKISEEFRMPLQTIDNQVNKVVILVNRLLNMSRAQMGRLEIKPEKTNLSELVTRQVQQASVRGRGHSIELDAEKDITGLWDAGYLDQVVGNLLDNAIRYSPEGGDIQVTLRRTDGIAHLAVADQGIGIGKEALPNLFKRYYRAESAKKVSAEGMGIGLYITHAIIEAHGGRIWVESAPGKGSTFHVELPVSKSTNVEAADKLTSVGNN